MLNKLKKIAKTILGIPLVYKSIRLFNIVTLSIASSNRLFSIIYHWFNFFPFSREQHAFIKGKYKYLKKLGKNSRNEVLLRRNVHRLEKGLIMKDRREIFAVDYIENTVKVFKTLVGNSSKKKAEAIVDTDLLLWANDVFTEYFNTVSDHPRINNAEKIFKKIDFKSDRKPEKIPYKREDSVFSGISYEDFYKLTQQRRSIRWFKDKKVSREVVDKAVKAAIKSPSACNRLPFKFKIYNDPKMASKVAKIPFGTSGYAENIPAVAVLIGEMDNYFSARDRHLIYIDASLAAMTFMFALETLGLGSTAINWPDFELLEWKLQKKLKLTVDQRPIMFIAFGYPDPEGKIPYSQKKSLNEILEYNEPAIGSVSKGARHVDEGCKI